MGLYYISLPAKRYKFESCYPLHYLVKGNSLKLIRLDDNYRERIEEAIRLQEDMSKMPREEKLSLPWSDFILVCRVTASQSYGSLGEEYLCRQFKLSRVTGNKSYDAVDIDGNKIEIKISIPKPKEKYNVVQVRPGAECDRYLICGVTGEGMGKIWSLSSQQMQKECDIFGASAHGKLSQSNPNRELRLSFLEGDANCIRWDKLYLIETII